MIDNNDCEGIRILLDNRFVNINIDFYVQMKEINNVVFKLSLDHIAVKNKNKTNLAKKITHFKNACRRIINIIDRDHGRFHNTFLIYATLCNKFDVVRLLLQHGANPNLRQTSNNKNVLDVAIETRNMDLVKFLLLR